MLWAKLREAVVAAAPANSRVEDDLRNWRLVLMIFMAAFDV